MKDTNRTPFRERTVTLYLDQWYILLGSMLIIVLAFFVTIAGVAVLGNFFSGPNANSSAMLKSYADESGSYPGDAKSVPISGADLTEGARATIAYADNTASGCSIGGVGVDQDGIPVILLALHCLGKDHGWSKSINIANKNMEYAPLTPTDTSQDFAFVRITTPGITLHSGAKRLSTDHIRFPRESCKVGITTGLTCGHIAKWRDEDYVSSMGCQPGDSGSAMTSVDRKEIYGIVGFIAGPRPGVNLCYSYPSWKIADAISSGAVPGLTSWTPTSIE